MNGIATRAASLAKALSTWDRLAVGQVVEAAAQRLAIKG